MERVLIIGRVWPEPASSAAGSRILQLCEALKQRASTIVFATPAARTEHSADLASLGIESAEIVLNDDSFDELVINFNPGLVIFDRFVSEEQFGWRVAKCCPDAMRVLDTEDLHCLREGRGKALDENRPFKTRDLLNEIAVREIASIYRCDLSLIISEYEMHLLMEFFKIGPELLHYCPFMLQSPVVPVLRYSERVDFVTIGNFLHRPNTDSVKYLKDTIWPLIRSALPEARLHVYGAYAPDSISGLNDGKNGFIVQGRTIDAIATISKARVLLAPLRFGAGLKGKLADAMLAGTPSVTTTIGAEGMNGDIEWCGAVADDPAEFAEHSVRLYTSAGDWNSASVKTRSILSKRFNKAEHGGELFEKIATVYSVLAEHRASNFTGQMLNHHLHQSLRYKSLWIQAKNHTS